MGLAVLTLLLAVQSGIPVAAPPPEKPKKFCRANESLTGSHIRRTCKTEEEWRRHDEARDQIPPSLRVTEGQDKSLGNRPQ